MLSKNLLASVAGTVLLLGYSSLSTAQTSISGDAAPPLNTSDLGDITIEAEQAATDAVPATDTSPAIEAMEAVEAGVVTGVSAGNLVTLDSDNTITNNGTIEATNVDDVVGVLITGGNTGNFTQTGNISLLEDFTSEDTDDDNVVEGPFAEGSNRTGILISGASPFIGNVEIEGGSIGVEGIDSEGIRLAADTSITGNIINSGALTVIGANSVGIDIEGNVIGELANNGAIVATGQNAQGINVEGDISGGFINTNTVSSNALRVPTRQPLATRESLVEENTLQSGSAIEINGNVDGGVLLGITTGLVEAEVVSFDDNGDPLLEEDGTSITELGEVATQLSISGITQIGAAPAVSIDGQGSPITLGVVGTAPNPAAVGVATNDPSFTPDIDLQFGFVNQGAITAQGILDDSPATAIELADVTIDGGILNTGAVITTTFRSGDDGTPDVDGFDGHSRGLFLSDNVSTDSIVNEGTISSLAFEAEDEVFADADNPVDARLVQSTALEISANSTVNSLTNSGLISVSDGLTTPGITARDGIATAIIDRSGTLSTITNQGSIIAASGTSDSTGQAATSFTNIALDLTANTSGISILQESAEGVALAPIIIGDILLGSGDDSFTSTAGLIQGDLDFGAGNDVFEIDTTAFTGTLSDSDGVLELTVTDNSILTQASTDDINVTNATFDGTTTFTTSINGQTNDAGTIVASDTITIEDGAQVQVLLENLVEDSQTFTILDADNLIIEDQTLETFASSVASSFLYDTTFEEVGETLVVTLDLRDSGANVSVEDGGLALDERQSVAFTSAFEALSSNAELGQAFAAITEDVEFNNAFNQLLPEISASPLYFIQASVDGAIGAVGSQLENARRSQDRTGGAWLEQYTFFADRELDQRSEQFRGFGFGFAGGVDTAWGPFHAVGVNVGFSSTQIEDVLGVDNDLKVVTYQAGTYAGAEWNNVSLDLNAGIGISDIESDRLIRIGDFTGQSGAEWNATHFNGSARLGYTASFGDRFWARPTVTVDYLRLDEDSFRETGTSGLALGVESRDTDRAGATALLNIGTEFNGNRTWIRPSLRGGYRTDFISDPVLTQFQFIDLADGNGGFFDGALTDTLESGDISDDGFILGFTIAAGSKWSSFSFDFDSDIRDGFIRHTGRVVLRLLF